MEVGTDEEGGSSNHHNSVYPHLEEHLLGVLSRQPALWALKRAVKEEGMKGRHAARRDTVQRLQQQLLMHSDLGHSLRNTLFATLEGMAAECGTRRIQELEEAAKSLPAVVVGDASNADGFAARSHPPLADELDHVLEARRKWSLMVQSRLLVYCKEEDVPLVQERSTATEALREKRHKDFLEEEGPSRALYDADNFLSFLRTMDSPNHTDPSCWHVIRLELATPSRSALQKKFAELNCSIRQLGLDEHLHGWFREERVRVGQSLRDATPFLPFYREYAKRGIPAGHRPVMWSTLLGLGNLGTKERAYFRMLSNDVDKKEYLIDDFVRLDLMAVADDPNFFVFEDEILSMGLAFFRDRQVPKLMSLQPSFLYSSSDAEGSSSGAVPREKYPPCGVTPWNRFSFFLAPMFFLELEPYRVYFMFRQLFCRYFCRLQVISSEPDTILSLCKAFEDMLIAHEPDLVVHLYHLGICPLDIAFPWIFSAFAGYLEIDQLFHLWDRILGFDTLLLLPCLAASIFIFRCDFLMETHTPSLVLDSFQDLSRLQVIPLLQSFLFGDTSHNHSLTASTPPPPPPP